MPKLLHQSSATLQHSMPRSPISTTNQTKQILPTQYAQVRSLPSCLLNRRICQHSMPRKLPTTSCLVNKTCPARKHENKLLYHIVLSNNKQKSGEHLNMSELPNLTHQANQLKSQTHSSTSCPYPPSANHTQYTKVAHPHSKPTKQILPIQYAQENPPKETTYHVVFSKQNLPSRKAQETSSHVVHRKQTADTRRHTRSCRWLLHPNPVTQNDSEEKSHQSGREDNHLVQTVSLKKSEKVYTSGCPIRAPSHNSRGRLCLFACAPSNTGFT